MVSATVVSATVAPAIARAHLGSTKYLRVDATVDGAHLVVDVDPIDVAYELGLPDPERGAVEPILARAEDVRAWAERSFVVTGEGGACTATVSEPEVVPIEGSVRMTRAIRVVIEHACPAPRTGLVLEDRSVFPADPQHEAIVRLGEHASVLRVGRQTIAIGEAPTLLDTILTFTLEGALHLITGYDHVLFLISLLLVAGKVAAREGTRKAMRDVALVVTGFTLGHSVTLIAAALDVVSLPSRFVESSIAASIVVVAIWNLVRPDARAGLPWVAVAFGLIHGFGFSSVLRELVLPAGERVAALVAFNVGIELAQLAIVAVVVPLLAWAARRTWYQRAVIQAGSVGIAAIASLWFVERAFFG